MNNIHYFCSHIQHTILHYPQKVARLIRRIIPKYSRTCNIVNLKDYILLDAQYIHDIDPASTSIEEVIECYTSYKAIVLYRVAHIIYATHPIIARQICEYAHSITGIDIHPNADIGCPFAIDHGTGIVIGATTTIGNYCVLYHGVTLGANNTHTTAKRHPTLLHHVTMYCNSSAFGNITIGHHCVVGAHCVVTNNVPNNTTVKKKY